MQPLRPDDPVRVAEYRLIGRLGAGGTGRVFLGRGPSGDLVAVKVVHARLAQRQDHRERLAREIAAARGVDPAFIAPVVDHDLDADEPWLATVYLPGLNLRQAVETRGPAPATSVRALGKALSRVLSAIHRTGTLHRDLKPSNVMLTPDGPRVVDFGISRPEGAAADTASGTLVGSPGYLPPERIRERVSDRAGDVFAFGALLYYAATGESPFGSGSTQVLLYRTQFERPRLDELRAVLEGDPELHDIIASCLALEPGRRPSAEELVRRFGAAPVSSRKRRLRGAAAGDAGRTSPRGCGAQIAAFGRRSFATFGLSTTFLMVLKSSAHGRPQEEAARRRPRPDGRTPLWTYRGADEGHRFDGLTVARDVVYVGSTRGLHALGCARGDTLWTAGGGEPVRPGAAVTAGTVLFGDERLRAVRASDGSPVAGWREPAVGGTGAPVVLGEQVYLYDGGGDLAAYDGRTGARRWRLALPRPGAAGGPARQGGLDPVAGNELLYVAAGGLVAVDPAARAVEWRFRAADTVPVVHAGLVYTAGARHVHALDAATGAVRWSRDIGGRVTGGVTVADGLVFAGDESGRLHALDAGTGRVRWRFGTGGPLSAAAPATAGTVYAAAEHDRLYAIETLSGRLRWSHPLGRQTGAHAQVWRDRILVCVDPTRLCALPR
ncbi:PQQ-binding-like beta-propeller repeat protein [Actinomadura sp. 21ATH]|uniref:protein kinase domain-containing protein n=1 Tax=Actinomadura sp. 21ATH TaxID=1735444 RepID=UPI0035BFCE40